MIQQPMGQAGDTIRDESSQDWERILLLVEVYQSLPRAALVMLLQDRGFEPVEELEALPLFPLASLAIYSHEGCSYISKRRVRLQRRIRQGHGPMMLDIPI